MDELVDVSSSHHSQPGLETAERGQPVSTGALWRLPARGTAELLRKQAGAHRGAGEGASPAGPEHTSAWEAPRGQAHRDTPAAGRTKILRNTDGVREACLPPSTWPPRPHEGYTPGGRLAPSQPLMLPATWHRSQAPQKKKKKKSGSQVG